MRENKNVKVPRFNVGDIVWVSNPDKEYENEYGIRVHRNFFGSITEIGAGYVEVDFGYGDCWAYAPEELSLSSDLKNMTLEEFSNTFGLVVNGVFAEYVELH